jgi:CBS domain-containing protein
VLAGLYALVCATATLAGVFRSAISLVVLVVEGTRGINFLFGIIVAVVAANWFAAIFQQDGVYESELERDGNVYFLRHDAPRKLSAVTAAEIMVPRPISFLVVTPVKDVLDVLENTTHHGFPVVREFEPAGSEGVGQLDGIVLRSQLIVLLKERCVDLARASDRHAVAFKSAVDFRLALMQSGLSAPRHCRSSFAVPYDCSLTPCPKRISWMAWADPSATRAARRYTSYSAASGCSTALSARCASFVGYATRTTATSRLATLWRKASRWQSPAEPLWGIDCRSRTL